MTTKTFRDFLQEADHNIQEKCGQFLEQSKGQPLYRGYGGVIASVFSGTREISIRKDRKPRDTNIYVHALLDAYFQKKFGVKVRSEGLFTTGDRQISTKYGQAYYVFPVGDFKFIWGTYKADPVADTLHWTRKIKDMMYVRYKKDSEDVTQQVMDEIDWHTDDLAKAIRSGAEIAILADKAIIVPYSAKVPYEKIISG